MSRFNLPIVKLRNIGGNHSFTIPANIMRQTEWIGTEDQFLVQFDKKTNSVQVRPISSKEISDLLKKQAQIDK